MAIEDSGCHTWGCTWEASKGKGKLGCVIWWEGRGMAGEGLEIILEDFAGLGAAIPINGMEQAEVYLPNIVLTVNEGRGTVKWRVYAHLED